MSAKPCTSEELAVFREVASAVKASDTNPFARLLATIDAVTAERDELRLRLARAEEALEVERAGAMHAQLEADALREAARTTIDRSAAIVVSADWINDTKRKLDSLGECDAYACRPPVLRAGSDARCEEAASEVCQEVRVDQ